MSQDNGSPKGPPSNNAEMWATVMAKLDSMQAQQNEALQEIKEEIQSTNTGFRHDISLLRNDLDGVKNTIAGYESKWEALEKCKQDLLQDVKK